MQPLRLLSVAEQTVEHLRKGLEQGRWSGSLPGVVRLAAECDVSIGVVRAAIRRLETEGLLVARGLGRCRGIAGSSGGTGHLRPLQVGMLLHDPRHSVGDDQGSRLLFLIQRDLEAAGHRIVLSPKSQSDLGHNVRRIARMVSETPADAWVVAAGSRGVLEWFAGQSLPSIALCGRSGGLPIARTGPDKALAYAAAARALVALGHRRIVLITLGTRRKPTPGKVERAFLAELAALGIATGDYNLPEWDETPEGFTALLENLFHTTPPTALIIDETARFIAAMQFLALRRIAVPSQVSMVSTDCEGSLGWCNPPIAQMKWNHAPIVRRIVRWVAAVQQGCPDRETINFPAEFIPGGSIGPVRTGMG
jgi:DNA-binding LacI/PurR family transcriptional regulator